MDSNYDTRQKVFLMVIALAASMVLLALNACQKAETGAANAVQAVGTVVDTSRDGAGESMPQAEDSTTATVEMIDTAAEKAIVAYQAVSEPTGSYTLDNGVDAYHFARDALDESFDKRADAHGSQAKMVATAGIGD